MKGELHPTENRACEADFLGTAGGGLRVSAGFALRAQAMPRRSRAVEERIVVFCAFVWQCRVRREGGVGVGKWVMSPLALRQPPKPSRQMSGAIAEGMLPIVSGA